MNATAIPEARDLVEAIVGAWRTQALAAGIESGVFEHLDDTPQPLAPLAAALEHDGDGLARLLRALCTLGVCREQPPEQFALTPAGRLLTRAGVDGVSLRALAQWWGGPMWQLWPGLGYSVRTGLSYREKLTGDAQYGHLERSAAHATVFHEAMQSLTSLVAPGVAGLALWRTATHLVDVGGGIGQLTLSVLQAHGHLRATVLDLAHAEPGANKQIAARGLADRCRFAIGSFFESVPGGADVYLLKSILHNWDDAHAGRILATCRATAPPGARLLVVERIRPEVMQPLPGHESVARADLNMLAGLGGRERTLQHYQQLLGAHGFRFAALHPTDFEFSIVEALAA